jgi:hypothetical protein
MDGNEDNDDGGAGVEDRLRTALHCKETHFELSIVSFHFLCRWNAFTRRAWLHRERDQDLLKCFEHGNGKADFESHRKNIAS